MEDLKKHKWLIIGGLVVAIFFIVKNYVLGKPAEEDPYAQYYQQQQQTQQQTAPPPQQPQQTQQQQPPRPGATPGTAVPRPGGGQTQAPARFEKYEEIIPEIYLDYTREKLVINNYRNFFVDFKLSPEMEKKAKEIIFTLETEITRYENLPTLSFNASEHVRTSREYLVEAKSAFYNKNYLKSEIFGNNGMMEIKKIEGVDQAIRGERRGPIISYYYKGYIISGAERIALVTKTTTDLAGREKSELLKLKKSDTIFLGGTEEYFVEEISRGELLIVDKSNERIRRNILIDRKF
ncbi:MAG: hypothetical protein WC337_02180 [Candidatus Muiribacteriota bacterium]